MILEQSHEHFHLPTTFYFNRHSILIDTLLCNTQYRNTIIPKLKKTSHILLIPHIYYTNKAIQGDDTMKDRVIIALAKLVAFIILVCISFILTKL